MKHEHTQVLQVARASMPQEKQLLALAELFKACGDGTRIKILYALSASPLCVCAIGELLHMQQSAVSHQLAKLKAARLVVSRRVGRTVYYSLADQHIKTVVATGFAHISEEA